MGDVADMPPNQFLLAIAGHAAHGTIGFDDNAIAHADHHSHRGLLERDPKSFLAGPQGFLGLLTPGDVLDCAEHPGRSSLGIEL